MAIETLVGTILSVLFPYLAKGGEEFAKEAGKDAFQTVKHMWEVLKTRLAGNKLALDALTSYEQQPTEVAPILANILARHLDKDQELVSQLTQDIKILEDRAGLLNQIIRIGKITHSIKTVHGNNTEINIKAGGSVHWKE